jgi:hypothetical protein
MKSGEELGALDVSSRFAVHVCGVVISQPSAHHLWIGFATRTYGRTMRFDRLDVLKSLVC